MLLQLLANGIANGCLYSLVAIGFALIYNTTRTFHMAHGAVYTAGAYLCYLFLINLGWPLVSAAALAVLLCAVLGVAMELVVYAPLVRREASHLVALLSSLGLYVALINVIALIFGNDTKVLRPGIEQTLQLGTVILTRIQIAQITAALVLLPAGLVLLRQTMAGKIIRAVRDNAVLASVLGVNQNAVRLWVFGVGSGVTALAAILAALDVGVDPNVGMPMLLTAAVACIVGGIGTFGGPVLGGFVLGTLQSLVIWKTSGRWTSAVTFGVLIAFLLFRPWGLLGRRRRLEEVLE